MPTLSYLITGQDKLSPTMNRAARNVTAHTKTMSNSFKNLGKMVGNTVGIVGLSFGLQTVYNAMINVDKQMALIKNGIKATGGVANVTAKHTTDLASAISGYSGQGKLAILSAERQLLAFTNVRNEAGKGNRIFDRATRAVADFSAATGTDSVSASKMLGKALQDPTTGLGALRRAGVVFTHQQTDQIKKMDESGDKMGAQKAILKALEDRYGGAAKAAGSTFGGQMNRVRNILIGVGTVVLRAVLPFLKKLADWFLKAPKWVQNVIIAVGLLGAALKIAGLSNPFTAIATALIILGGLVWHYRKTIAKWFSDCWNTIKDTFSAMVRNIKTWLYKLQVWFLDALKVIVHALANAFGWMPLGIGDSLKKADKKLGDWIKSTQDKINSLQGKRIDVWTRFGVRGPAGGGYPGGVGVATGGFIRGPGTKTSDSVPAYLSQGEYVVRAAMVDKYGKNFFDKLNAGHYAQGGLAKMGVTMHFPSPAAEYSAMMQMLNSMAKTWVKTLPALTGSAAAIIRLGASFLGKVPYVWGGDTPRGWDCSGFISYLYRYFHILNGRLTAEGFRQWGRGTTGPVPGGYVLFGRPAYHVALSAGGKRTLEAGGGMTPTWGSIAGASGFGIPPARRFDLGGWLNRGYNLVYNGTGQPEYVSPDHGNTYIVNVHTKMLLSDKHAMSREIVDALQDFANKGGKLPRERR